MLRRSGLCLLAASLFAACGGSSAPPPYTPGQPLTVDVSSVFPAGTTVRDRYANQTATVGADGKITLTPAAEGVLLLEKDGAPGGAFTWKDATVYFAMTDRFFNGDTSNDGSYGRKKDGKKEIGTWHGGDWKGLQQKLPYLADLGVTAIWVSPIVEQVHGWVAGGSGAWQHYAYHGYWALDYTRLDANFGNEADFKALVDAAHAAGIRVLVDVVMNHPGYATGADLVQYLPTVFKDGTGTAFKAFDGTGAKGWDGWNDLVNYDTSTEWVNWWGPDWIRAGFVGYDKGGTDELTRQLNFLPDFKTESTKAAAFPILLQRKTDTAAAAISGATVRQYLVKWHTDWVRKFGIDGFRCDTAMNVELESWKALKDAGVAALTDWRTTNHVSDTTPFWTTGEAFGKGVGKDAYYTSGGFDSMINFAYQSSARDVFVKKGALALAAADVDQTWAAYASSFSGDPSFNALTYLSSHDTQLFFDAVGHDVAKQKQAAAALLLTPGAVQIYYGDESGRQGSDTSGDATQATRSDMNWSSTDAGLLAHWQKLGTFRRSHPAVGAGTHQRLSSPPDTYAFSRTLAGQDSVVVVLTAPR